MLIFELEDQTRIAVRGSGTEPKIKYYLFAQRAPNEAKFSGAAIGADQNRKSQQHLESLWAWLQEDAHARLALHKLLDSRRITLRESLPMHREIKLDGGEITVLKTLGLSGSHMYGKHADRSRRRRWKPAEFIDTLNGLIVARLRSFEQGQRAHASKTSSAHSFA